MPTMRLRFLSLMGAAVLAVAAPARAQPASGPPPSHVRPEADLRTLFEQAQQRSLAVRGLVEQLETMDVTVYVRARTFDRLDLDGRIALLSVNGTHRYLVIELACGHSDLLQMATLGHELFHALEIAFVPAIVDARTLADHYARVGMQTEHSGGRHTYETRQAAAMGARVRQELLHIGHEEQP
jgi:hypothetical protein